MSTTTPAPDVVFVSGPTYNNGTRDLLIPFTYANGKLDIASNAAYPSGTVGQSIGNAGASVRLLGGNSQVTTIGTNLKNLLYSRTWDSPTGTQTITSNANIRVASPGFVTRVQQLSSTYLAPTWNEKSYKAVAGAWNGANFIGESTVYMFNKPLVLQTSNSSGTTICITLQSSWDH